jgi:class 3 adenylate cyclase
VETRFARTPSGPVPYRVDGDGSTQLMIISDWATPYGEPGRPAFDTFAAEMAKRGVRTVTLLDGTTRRAEAPSVDDRVQSAQAVTQGAKLEDATLLGVADGGPVAARLAMRDGGRFARLVLYDTFPVASADAWKLPPRASSELAAIPSSNMPDLGDLATQIKAASAAAGWAHDLWQRSGGKERRAKRSGPPPPLPPAAAAALDWIGEEAARQVTPVGGLKELLGNVMRLEAARGTPGDSLIRIPTLVLDAGSETGAAANPSLGLEVAAQIDGARHRVVTGRSRWPWGDIAIESQLLEPTVTAALPEGGASPAPDHDATAGERILATVLFTDIVGSTERLAELGDAEWRRLLERHHRLIRAQISAFGGREVDNAGDGFLASFETPARAVRCAAAIRGEMQSIGLTIRFGVHTGECEVIGDKLVGIAVHVGARIASQAAGGEILVSAVVRDLVAGSGIGFEERGSASLKGLPRQWILYSVTDVAPRPA